MQGTPRLRSEHAPPSALSEFVGKAARALLDNLHSIDPATIGLVVVAVTKLPDGSFACDYGGSANDTDRAAVMNQVRATLAHLTDVDQAGNN